MNYDIKLDPYQDGENYVEPGVVIVTDEEDISITQGEDGGVTAITIVDENGETSTME